MAPKQKTFELVPTTVGLQGRGQQDAPLSRPPMTTKQAKKAYRKANKGPKLSKAEQRRIELMEQDRIRKEFEKERNQARARTARDRKKAKEDKEKENRKRKGLPLVDVHPSQDTISRFVNRAAAQLQTLPNPLLEATKEEEDAETESATDAEEDHVGEMDKENKDSEERGAKRQRLSRQNSNQHPADPLAKMAQAIATESASRASSVDIDDPINQDLLQEQLIADVVLASSRKTSNSSPIAQDTYVAPDPPKDPPPAVLTARTVPPQLQERRPLGRPHFTRPEDVVRGCNPFHTTASPYLSAGRPYSGTQMRPPPRFKAPTEPLNYHEAKPRFLPKHLRTPHERSSVYEASAKRVDAPPGNDLPTSTQLFLLDHVDDFFPSPSQEVHELLEDEEKKAPKTGGTLKSSNVPSIAVPVEKPNVKPPIVELAFDFPMSTQDFTFSSQDMRDIETPSKPSRSREGVEKQMSLQTTDAAVTVPTCRQDKGSLGVHPPQNVQNGHDAPKLSEDVMSTKLHATNSTAAKLPQATPKPIDKPSPSPPRKRMFGSSGPGAEVLVAMERSYQQSRREERAREEERRAQERLLPMGEAARGPDTDCAEMNASQETDYGDIDIGGDDLAFLEDTTWLEDDLDDCL